ncbi:MAG TPA: DUF6644 family protein [Methylomirabilota bacterium]|nr:DUF6644 family protein [Methylomirabilota bacterium]
MHPPEGPAWLVALESSGFAAAMRHWLWLYPFVEITHILGFVLLVGAAVMFDLRLLGVSPRIPVSDLARHLLPWSRIGLGFVAPSGLAMFSAHATEWIANPAFWVKLSLIALAGINAWTFHRWTFQSVATWERNTPAPAAARASAVASLALWTGVVTCGRLLAYL